MLKDSTPVWCPVHSISNLVSVLCCVQSRIGDKQVQEAHLPLGPRKQVATKLVLAP